MTKIARDSRRGVKVPRKIVCVSSEGITSVNEIQKDPKRQEKGLTMGTGFPVGKHLYLLQLIELEKMAANGEIRPVMDNIASMGIDTFNATKKIASGIMEHNKKLNLGDMFPSKTCPPKFSLNKARGIILDRAQTLIYD
jgi:hypothetical protein